MWLFFAFAAPALYAVAEIVDNYLSNRLFKNPWTIVFYASLFNLLFLPVLFYAERPVMPSASLIPIILVLGFINFGYLYPYYKGLQNDDTSVVSAFFGIGRIFIPILAFLIVGEVLSPAQYVGVALIIISSVLLSFHKRHAKLLFSKSFWYIGLAAFMLSFEGVLLKYLFNHGVNYSTAVGGELIVSTLFALPLILFPAVRKDLSGRHRAVRALIPVLAFEELFTFLAFSAEAYAITLAPVTIVKSIAMASPFFILLFGGLLKRRFPRIFHEHTGGGAIMKKTLLFTAMIFGILLLGNYD
jgi:drug/metabolite transporter (DMT)-like permease